MNVKRSMPPVNYNTTKSSLERYLDYAAIGLIAVLLLYTVKNFISAPATIPMHFDISGEVDSWGSRWTLWILPIVAVGVFFLLALVEKFPQHMNYPVKITEENAQRQFVLARSFIRTLRVAMAILFLFIQRMIVQAALHISTGPTLPIMSLILGIVFIPIIIYMVLAFRLK